MLTKTMITQGLLDGTYDGIQIHICYESSFVTLYQGRRKKISVMKQDMNACREYVRLVYAIEELPECTFLYRKNLVEGGWITRYQIGETVYCDRRHGVSSNLHYLERYREDSHYRESISLTYKTKGVSLVIGKNDDPLKKLGLLLRKLKQ